MLKLLQVLIESDWNLKEPGRRNRSDESGSINRIRLEFKGIRTVSFTGCFGCINRIRLEFKEDITYSIFGG